MEITSKQKTIKGLNTLKVTIDSNCPMGGDRGHGGYTAFEIENLDSTQWEVIVEDNEGKEIGSDDFKKIRLIFYGDSENETIRKALVFGNRAIKQLRQK